MVNMSIDNGSFEKSPSDSHLQEIASNGMDITFATESAAKECLFDMEELLAPRSNQRAPTVGLGLSTWYGDFCFDPPKRFAPMKNEYGKFNALFEENGSFERSEPFPFFKLPLEIRHRIYCLICAPCASDTRLYPNNSVLILVKSVPTPDAKIPPWYTQSLGSFYEQQQPIFTKLQLPIHMIQQAERQFIQKRAKYIKGLQIPFDRDYPYQLCIQPPHAPFDSEDVSVIRLIRDVTSTCTQMRQEFGSVLWSRSTICSPCFNAEASEAMLGFLRDRPGIHQGIRGLDLEIDPDTWDLSDDANETAHEAFEELGQYLSTFVKVEKLIIMLCVYEYELEDVVDTLETFPITQLIQQMPVTKEFEVIMSIYIDDEALEFEEDRDAYHDSLEAKYEERIYLCWLPDSLLEAEPETEKEKYLAARRKTFERSSSVSRVAEVKEDIEGG